MSEIHLGDIVAIRGEDRINNDGKCAYTPDQMIDGLLKHTGHEGIWTGKVLKVNSERVFVGGRWWLREYCKVMFSPTKPGEFK